MLKPSYSELMDVLNANTHNKDNEVTSRYSIVIAAAKRARQIIDGDEPMVETVQGEKALSVAVDELDKGKIEIVGQGEGTVVKTREEREREEKLLKTQEEVRAELADKEAGDDIEDALEEDDELEDIPEEDDGIEDALEETGELEDIPEEDEELDDIDEDIESEESEE